jgi:hypothetical protein
LQKVGLCILGHFIDMNFTAVGCAMEHVTGFLGTARKFLSADFQEGDGMKVLIQSLYRSISEGAPLPIPYREILRTSRIMDEIFSQVHSAQMVLSREGAVRH